MPILRETSVEPSPLVLVIEQDDAIRGRIRAVLEHGGFRVVGTAGGAEAIRQIKRAVPGIVVLDASLPVLHPEAIVMELRIIYGPSLPILVTTSKREISLAVHLDAYAVLFKPFAPWQLLSLVAGGLGIGGKQSPPTPGQARHHPGGGRYRRGLEPTGAGDRMRNDSGGS